MYKVIPENKIKNKIKKKIQQNSVNTKTHKKNNLIFTLKGTVQPPLRDPENKNKG